MLNKVLLTENAINYSFRQLAQRVGIPFPLGATTGFDALGIQAVYGHPEDVKVLTPSIIIRPCSKTSWGDLLSASENSLSWIQVDEVVPQGCILSFSDSIPVLFWGEKKDKGTYPFAEWENDNCIVFNADILAASFFMLSRWEEMVVPIRDRHDRFQAITSVAYKQGFLDRPVIDEYALILQEWIKVLLPGWKPEKRMFSIELSHDIDHMKNAQTVTSFLLTLTGDLVKRHSLKKFTKTFVHGIREFFHPKSRLMYQGVMKLATIALNNGFISTFYFKSSSSSSYDSGYNPEKKWIRDLILYLHNKGFKVGFHPGYYTQDKIEMLLKEKERLEKILGESIDRGRQHYLRFWVPNIWRFFEKVNILCDSSIGYHDHEGFRCGTCHPFSPFDLERDQEFSIVELPLIVMDITIVKYRSFLVKEAEERMLELAKRCKDVGGVFTLSWHNTSLEGEWKPWAEVYEKVVTELSNMYQIND